MQKYSFGDDQKKKETTKQRKILLLTIEGEKYEEKEIESKKKPTNHCDS